MRKWLVLGLSVLIIGCSQKSPAEHGASVDKDKDSKVVSNGTKVDPDETSWDSNSGLYLPRETLRALNLTTTAVQTESFAVEIKGEFHVFRESSEEPIPDSIYQSGFAYGSEVGPADDHGFQKGDRVEVEGGEAPTSHFDGVIVGRSRLPAPSDNQQEILIQIADPSALLHVSQSVHAILKTADVVRGLVVPQSAILSCTEGVFVYLKKGDRFARVAVKISKFNEQSVQVINGLGEGDEVVVNPVQQLWLIELRFRTKEDS